MTTETNGNSKSLYAATGPQILAYLLLLQQRHTLPDWTALEVRAGRQTVDLRFAATADVERWAVAMGRDPKHINHSTRTDGSVHAWIVVQLGSWKIDCEGTTAPSSTLDADTVAALEDVTEPRCPSCGEPERLLASGAVGHCGDACAWRSDPEPERVSDDRVGEILAALNSFVVFELEPYTEIIDGVSVLKREIVGADYNLDQAVAWAIDLPEVSSTGGPDRGKASVELVDGTVLEFVPAEKSWSVTVSDEPVGASS